MGLFGKFHNWRQEKIEEARTDGERRARAKGASASEAAEAGDKAARRRKRRAYIIGGNSR